MNNKQSVYLADYGVLKRYLSFPVTVLETDTEKLDVLPDPLVMRELILTSRPPMDHVSGEDIAHSEAVELHIDHVARHHIATFFDTEGCLELTHTYLALSPTCARTINNIKAIIAARIGWKKASGMDCAKHLKKLTKMGLCIVSLTSEDIFSYEIQQTAYLNKWPVKDDDIHLLQTVCRAERQKWTENTIRILRRRKQLKWDEIPVLLNSCIIHTQKRRMASHKNKNPIKKAIGPSAKSLRSKRTQKTMR